MEAFRKFNARIAALPRPLPGQPSPVIAPVGGGMRGLLLSALAARFGGPILALVAEEKEVPALLRDFRFFQGEGGENSLLSLTIPARRREERKFLYSDAKRQAQRMAALYHLLESPQQTVLVLSAEAISQKTLPAEALLSRLYSLEKGQAQPREALVDWLVTNGYLKTGNVEQPGEFSVRGGLIDLFSPQSPRPLRIEYLGDEIESMRSFAPHSQRSLTEEKQVTLVPAREVELAAQAARAGRERLKDLADQFDVPLEKRRALDELLADGLFFSGLEQFLPAFYPQATTVFDYLEKETLFVSFEGDAIAEQLGALEQEAQAAEKAARAREELFFPPEKTRIDPQSCERQLQRFARIAAGTLGLSTRTEEPDDSGLRPLPPRPADNVTKKEQNLVQMHDFLARLPRGRKQVVLGSDLQVERFEKMLPALVSIAEERSVRATGRSPLRDSYNVGTAPFQVTDEGTVPEIPAPFPAPAEGTLPDPPESRGLTGLQSFDPATLALVRGHLSSGFILFEDEQAVVSENDLFAVKALHRKPQKPTVEALFSLADFKEGERVVHVDYGIGIYQGLKRIKTGGQENDFCLLEYAGNDRLFLPVDRLNLLQKYIGAGGKPPALDQLGGNRWEKAKRKASAAADEMAEELLQLYARRKIEAGFSHAEPDEIFARFEAEFPFEETQDQATAIEQVLGDMHAPQPMDRLICGDVGFGKTEVAIRAALLAVLSGKQVAVLVPTTVLAQQHFSTFSARLAGYPLCIDMLSRFRTPAEQKQSIAHLASGNVDIIIGTHRLLSADVHFSNLGLLVLDEEQRFGVGHKEKIKQLKCNVDVLTLSATPIPRTLQLSLLALRDLSVINTPPADRQAIQTAVARFDDGLIQDAVRREVKRRGQVFFVHNRVESIAAMAAYLQRILPEVRVGVAHGQMKAAELERVMLKFLEGELDLLLCTAIIESGLDIPNANTLIINRADQFGLAQLYQLRGRVGRSARSAHAYLLVPGEEMLSRDARKRLAALREFSALGSGFRIAIHDLEIRGGGNILGHKQSGQISQVGFEMYCRLLDRAVRKLKGEKIEEGKEPELALPIPAYIPEDYLPDSAERLLAYKRLSQAESDERLQELAAEMKDRYGPAPETLKNLISVISLKIAARRAGAEKIELGRQAFAISFGKQAELNVPALVGWVKGFSRGTAQLDPSGKLTVKRRKDGDLAQLAQLKKILLEIAPRG